MEFIPDDSGDAFVGGARDVASVDADDEVPGAEPGGGGGAARVHAPDPHGAGADHGEAEACTTSPRGARRAAPLNDHLNRKK